MWSLFRHTMVDDRKKPLLPKFEEPLNIPELKWIPAEKWAAVKDPIRKVVNCVRPTLEYEEMRKEVIEYMRKLIGSNLGVEVYAYGSVPLKTYLPEGDIDLTVISTPDKEHDLPKNVLHLLNSEAFNPLAEFEINQIRFINAEVKIVKCIVGGFIMDVSFNQFGGLCSLGFLEQADRIFGRDHLFKRSIILIKSWCYYESRILGASYGLLSTYTLEILILFILFKFRASLTNPLMVLYGFMAYYGDFDSENFCISLDGPVKKKFLPKRVVENPMKCSLLGDILKIFRKMFSVPYKDFRARKLPFIPKYLNIIDPLKKNNNLGRSVNKGTFSRIRFALRHGARELGKILQLPKESIPNAVEKFFSNTLQSNYRYRIIPAPVLTFPPLSLASNTDDENEVDASELELWNADFSYYVSDTEDASKGESSKGIGLFASSDPANEDSDVSGLDNESDGSFCDLGNPDAFGDIDETEYEDLKLINLTGDYYGNVRNLLYSVSCHGFPFSAFVAPAVHRPTRYNGDELHELSTWFHHNLSYPYPYPYGPVVQTARHVKVPGTNSYIPATGAYAYTSTGGWGRESGSPSRTCEEYGSPSRTCEEYGSPSRTCEEYGMPARTCEEYGSPSRTCEEYGSPARTCEEYGLPARTCEEYGLPARTCEEYGSPARTCEEYGLPAWTCEEYGSPSRTCEEYGLPTRTFEEYGSPSRTCEEYGSPTRTCEEYGLPTRTCEEMSSISSVSNTSPNSREQSPPSSDQSPPRVPNRVTPQRRLEFGSFASRPETSSNVMDRFTSLLRAITPQGTQNALLHLQDDKEFPPLTA